MWPGLGSNCPGHPTDVHPDLQFFRQAINSFIWCEDFYSMEPVSAKIAPYQFEACEAMGRPITGLPIYVASPLNIAGESLDIAFANSAKLSSVWVNSMPSLGANTPLNIIAAYSQTIAETLGGAVLFEELTGVPAYFGTNLFTFDFYAMSMPFGTPEKLILEWMNMEVYARLGGGECKFVYSTDIHTNAICSGMQACVEKASLAMAGAMRGAQSFGCSGTLGMDELFSPVQLLIDLEMLNHIQHIIDGMPVEDFDGDLLEEVRAGIKAGYMGTDRTLDNFSRYQWHPRFFNRKSFGSYLQKSFPLEVERARDLANELAAKEPGWKLADDKSKQLEDIYKAAEKSLL
jgi:trimethylamine:corrinoid methyltransferase-like protein